MSGFYGLIGKKLGHSFSQVINDILLSKIGLNGTYNMFEIKRENLKRALDGLKVLGCKGANVTIPYKIEIMRFMDKISKEACEIGAINTIKFCNDNLEGYNTDYYGFGMTLKKYKIDVFNKNVIILGTGGASMAVEKYIEDKGASNITYVSRNPYQNQKAGFNVISYEKLKNVKNYNIIINCTPCGMYPEVNNSAVDSKILGKFDTAIDLIYNPKDTLFLKMAKKLGLNTINGLYMLIAQNVASNRIWHDVDISLNVVDLVYDEFNKKNSK